MPTRQKRLPRPSDHGVPWDLPEEDLSSARKAEPNTAWLPHWPDSQPRGSLADVLALVRRPTRDNPVTLVASQSSRMGTLMSTARVINTEERSGIDSSAAMALSAVRLSPRCIPWSGPEREANTPRPDTTGGWTGGEKGVLLATTDTSSLRRRSPEALARLRLHEVRNR